MKFSFLTASSPEWTPEEAINNLSSGGWDGIEWRLTDQEESAIPGFWVGNKCTIKLSSTIEYVQEIAEKCRANSLDMSGVAGYAKIGERENITKLFQLCQAMGAKQVRVTMPHYANGDYSEIFATAKKEIDWLIEAAKRHNLKVLIELHHDTITASASAAMRLIEGKDPKYIGVIHDIGNLVIEGYEDYLAAFSLLGPYLAHIHVKNATWQVTNGKWSWQWSDLAEGQANIGEYFRALNSIGYDSWVTFEDFTSALNTEKRASVALARLHELSKHAKVQESAKLSINVSDAHPSASTQETNTPKIVHLGLGAFFKAHQAYYTALCNATESTQWKYHAFSGRKADAALAMQANNNKYSILSKTPSGCRVEQINVVAESTPSSDTKAWIEATSDINTKIISLTITESGYCINGEGDLDINNKLVIADINALQNDITADVKTAPAKLVSALANRKNIINTGVSVMSCDNLNNNGEITKTVVLQFADKISSELSTWIENKIDFVSTMVDRITPATTSKDIEIIKLLSGRRDTASVVSEEFSEWVICDNFRYGRPKWEKAGAVFTNNISVYEKRKLWLLNAGHSHLAYLGLAKNITTVYEAMLDRECYESLQELWRNAIEVIDLPEKELKEAITKLEQRFTNKNIEHKLSQIALGGAQKIPTRIFSIVQERIKQNKNFGEVFAQTTAAWIHYLEAKSTPDSERILTRTLNWQAENPSSYSDRIYQIIENIYPEILVEKEFITAINKHSDYFKKLEGEYDNR